MVFWSPFEKDSWVPLWCFTRFPGSDMCLIYKWSFQIGPLEIRKWASLSDNKKEHKTISTMKNKGTIKGVDKKLLALKRRAAKK